MSDTQISWITSLLSLGGLVRTILAGTLADILVRKNFLLALAVPQLVSSSINKPDHFKRIHTHTNFQLIFILLCPW